jgi:hypothetical protein
MVHRRGLGSGNITAAVGERDKGEGEKRRSQRSGAVVGGGQWIQIWAWAGVLFWPVVSGWTWRWVFVWEVAASSDVGSGLGSHSF